MNNKQAFIFVGGGTGGHVYPTLAVAAAVRDLVPEAKFYYAVSGDGPELDLVDWQEFEALDQTVCRLPKRKINYPVFAWQSLRGIIRAIGQLRRIRPKFVFSGGGFVSGPLLTAAILLGIPCYTHEQNAVAGRVTRLFATKVNAVFSSFPGLEKVLPESAKVIYSGNPVRRAFFDNDQASSRQELELDQTSQILLVLGGSLGAKVLNDSVADLPNCAGWAKLREDFPEFRIKLVTGLVNSRIFTAELDPDGIISVETYVDTEVWMPAADLILGRAGASILMEVAATGKPAIIVPFPTATNQEQVANAGIFADAGAAIVIQESDFNADRLLSELYQLLKNKSKAQALARQAKLLAKRDAASEIASILVRED